MQNKCQKCGKTFTAGQADRRLREGYVFLKGVSEMKQYFERVTGYEDAVLPERKTKDSAGYGRLIGWQR